MPFYKHLLTDVLKTINRLIKQIGCTAYAYGNSLNYFFRIRLQLFNRKHINASFMNLLTKKTCESDKIIRFTSYISQIQLIKDN